MSCEIKMSFTEISLLAYNLKVILDEIRNAETNADTAAEATGHDDLARHVRDFANRWKIKRDEMVESLEGLQAAVETIVETFTDVDKQLGCSLSGEGDGGGTSSGDGTPSSAPSDAPSVGGPSLGPSGGGSSSVTSGGDGTPSCTPSGAPSDAPSVGGTIGSSGGGKTVNFSDAGGFIVKPSTNSSANSFESSPTRTGGTSSAAGFVVYGSSAARASGASVLAAVGVKSGG